MKKSIFLLCCLFLVIVYFAFFQIKKYDVSYVNGYASTVDIKEIANNLKTSNNVNISLKYINAGATIYKNNNNYFVGDEKKEKVSLDLPIFNTDNSRIWNYSTNNYINANYYDTGALTNVIVADKNIYNTNNDEAIDTDTYVFVKLKDDLYLTNQDITLELVQETITIPTYSIIYFNKEYLNYYYRHDDALVYKTIPYITLETNLKILDKEMTYETLLTRLGLITKTTDNNTKPPYIKDDDKPNYDDNNNSNKPGNSDFDLIIDDVEIKENDDNYNNNDPNYVKPEITFDGFNASVYSATSTIGIKDPAGRIVTMPTFTFKYNNKTYLRKSFGSNGAIEVSGLLPNQTFDVEGYFIFKNERNETVRRTFYTGKLTTNSIDKLNPITLNYQINEIFSNRIVINDILITNDVNDEIFKGLKSAKVLIDKEEYNFSSDLINKMKIKTKVTYQTPDVLESSTDYTGFIKIYDVAGNELRVNNSEFQAKTSKQAPSATIHHISNDLTLFDASITLNNKDNVALSNYHYEVYDINNNLVKEGALENKETNKITVNNLDSNYVYKIYVIGNYDLLDGKGTRENQILAQAQITTKPISALGSVKFIAKELSITKDSGKYSLKINKESTDEKLITLLDRIIITVKKNDTELKKITLSGEAVETLKSLDTYEFELLGLESNTEYTLSYETVEKQVDKEYQINATSNITSIKTLRTPAYAIITNQFTNESIIDFDIRIVDRDNAIQSNRTIIQIKDEQGNYVLLKELSINGNEERITLNKLSTDTNYYIDIIAEGYNEGYTNRTYKTNYVLEGSRTLRTKLGVSAQIRLENLLSVVTSKNIFNINYTDNFRFDGASTLNKIATDVDQNIIRFSAMNGYANYSYYIPEYKNTPVVVSFKARYAASSNNGSAYLTVGAGTATTYPLNLTNDYQDYKIELIPDNGYLGFGINETNGKNNTTTIEVADFQIAPYLNYNTPRTKEMSIYDRNYTFTDTKILSGNDTITEPDGKEETGHIGDGYARITNLNTNTKYDFAYTGTIQEFKTLEKGNYLIETWGASGGDNYNSQYLTANSHGGRGGYSSGIISLDKDTTLYIVVGGRGKYGTNYIAGGFNGGGSGGQNASGSGGGATDVRLISGTTEFESLKSRIMVAGGGGGSDDYGACTQNCSLSNDGSGGAGGGITSEGAYIDGILHTRYSAGQLPVNTINFSNNTVNTSILGIGEAGSATDTGGGGGGYYGGVATKHNNGGASGGSSYVSGHIGCVSINYKDNLSLDDTYSKYEEKYQYQGEFYVTVVDNNYETTGSPQIPNSDFYIEIVKSDNSVVGTYHYNLDDNEIIDHKVENMLVTYNFEKGTNYTLNLKVYMNNRFYTITSMNFKTDDQIRTIRDKEDFYNMSSTGNFLIANDIDLRYQNRTISGEFNGNIDFQGHKLLLNVKNSASRVFASLGKGAVIKNMDMHIWYDEARSRYDTLTDWSAATFNNIMITLEEAVKTPSEQISFLVRVNRGTVDHFVVNSKVSINVTRYFGFISNYLYGTVKNGYLYGETINGNHDSGLDDAKYIGAIGGYMSESGIIENVYSLINVIGFSSTERPNQVKVGNLVGVVSRGTINNSYSYNENSLRNNTLDASVGSYDQLNVQNLYYVSPLKYSNAKTQKISKVALASSEFQNNTLNSESAFNIEDFVSYGYFPQLIMNEAMPKQEYIKLPEVTNADLLSILTTSIESQNSKEATVNLLIRNPAEEQIKEVEIQYFTTEVLSQTNNPDGSSLLKLKLTKPSRYISSYGINSMTSVSKSNITYTTKFETGSVILNIDMYRDINNENDWFNIKTYPSENFVLNADLDFSNYINPVITTTVTGKINGNNHTIKNVTNNTNDGILFRVFQGTLSNLYLENLTKTNYATTSGVIGYLQSSATVDNVHIKNITLKLGNYTGAIAGLSRYSSNIKNSSVTNFSVTDSVDINEMRLGGIVGQSEQSNIINSYAAAINFNLLNSSQFYAVGGLVGYNSYGIITTAYTTGNINTNYPNTGGLVGINYGRVENVISNMKIISSQIYAGGIIGNDINNNVSNTLFTGELYSSLETEAHRTIGNKNLANHSLYAWASQKINGVISNYGSGEELLTTEELNSIETYTTKMTLGDAFDYSQIGNNTIPKLYYANQTELLPNQSDNYLDISDDNVLKIAEILVDKVLDKANVTISITNNNMDKVKVTGIKIEDIEEIKSEDIQINNENSGLDNTSLIKLTMYPKYYLDSYRISKLYYTEDGVAKELELNSKIDVTFFRNINSVDDFQKINTNYSENYSINANLDFSKIDNSIIHHDILANKVEGNNYTISNYKLNSSDANTFIFKEVRTYMKNLNFDNITLNYTGSNSVNGLGVVGTAYGEFGNININNLTLNGNKKVSRVGFISKSYVNDYRDINLSGVTISGTNRLGSLYGEGDTYYLTTIDVVDTIVSGTGDYVGGLIGYKHDNSSQKHFYITASNVNVTTTGGNYSGIVYGYGAALNVTVKDSSVSGNNLVGGVGGRQDTDSVSQNRLTNVNVSGKGSQIGGIYGYHDSLYNSSIKDSTISGGTSQVGGISGYGGWSIYNCSVINTIISSPNATSVGGIEGLDWDGNRYNNYVYNTSIEGKSYVGGLVGNKNGTPASRYYDNFINASIKANDTGAGGILGYYQNNLEEENVRRVRLDGNIIASSTITSKDATGGLIGAMYKPTDSSLNLFHDNLIAVSITTTGTNKSNGIIVGTSDLYIKGLSPSYVYNQSKINNLLAQNIVSGLNETITFVSAANMKNQTLMKSYVGQSSNYNYQQVEKGYYPYNGAQDASQYQVDLPTGVINRLKVSFLANTFSPLANATIYASSINTLNFDFDTLGGYITINDYTYQIDDYTLSIYYDFKEDFTYTISNSVYSKTYTVSAKDFANELLTINNNYYYLETGTIYSNNNTIEGEYIHMFNNEALDNTGNIIDLNTGNKKYVSIKNFVKLNETVALVNYDYRGSKIKTYATYSMIDKAKTDNQIFIKNINMAMINKNFANNKTAVIVDYFNDKKILLTLCNGKITSLMNDIKLPGDFINQNIIAMSNNINNETSILLVKYQDNTYYAFDYRTGKKIDITKEEAKSKVTLKDFLTEYINNSTSDKTLESYEDKYENANTFITNLDTDKIISYTGYDTTEVSKTNILDNYAVSYNPLKNEYEVYNIPYITSKSTSSNNINTSINDTINQTSTISNSFINKYKGETKDSANGKIIFIIIIAFISVALSILGLTLKSIYSKKINN